MGVAGQGVGCACGEHGDQAEEGEVVGVDLLREALGEIGEDTAFVVGGDAELEAGGGLEWSWSG